MCGCECGQTEICIKMYMKLYNVIVVHVVVNVYVVVHVDLNDDVHADVHEHVHGDEHKDVHAMYSHVFAPSEQNHLSSALLVMDMPLMSSIFGCHRYDTDSI